MSSDDPHRIEGLRRPSGGKSGFPSLRAAVFVLVLGGVILPFTPPGEKILRREKKLLQPPPPPVVEKVDDGEDLRRQLEARHRQEMEELEANGQSVDTL